ncbi:hypothetical protein A2U01_0091080, partial [Trifolium medium]|nr:hypothetical protein [Trifolium medium]
FHAQPDQFELHLFRRVANIKVDLGSGDPSYRIVTVKHRQLHHATFYAFLAASSASLIFPRFL